MASAIMALSLIHIYYQARLQRRSGPSALGVALVIGVIFGLSMVLTAVIGPERLLAMSNMMML